ncbi:MAG: class I SAM-dependent methyltransferase [Ktedonobacteraceae bacterium]
MSRYYTKKRARRYNVRWRTFTERSLTMVLTMIDDTALHAVLAQQGRPARVLDVACGTGLLLQAIIKQVPEVEGYGVDASEDMLAQAAATLEHYPQVYLQQAVVRPDERAGLPYATETFDLITCTNALHDMMEPLVVLRGLEQLLAPGGQLVLEDYARREPAFPWAMVEWLARRIEGGQGHAFTLAEAQEFCTQAGLHVDAAKAFNVNWLWHNWVLRSWKRSS